MEIVDALLMYVKAFFVGGTICAIGQLLIMKTQLTSARILVGYVTVGVILGALADMTAGRDQDTQEMRSKGECFAEEQTNDEYYVYELSNAFLDNKPFHLTASQNITPGVRHIISQALKASDIIDHVDGF